ncbi:MAG TPA: hypothetical protein VI547_05135 [Anaerolineales bacterium]|nr:hypothetical protein [Anaerolineales bacterium]
MNTHITRKIIAIVSSLLAVCALALGSLFIAPVSSAYAAPAAEEGTPGPFADGSRLELACREVERRIEGQQDRLNFAKDMAAKTESWIKELKTQGKDVSALESALAAYQAALATAQSQHDEAANIMDTQAGFDGNCKVTDREQAADTLRDAGDALRTAHRTLADAGRTLRRAIHEWRKANRPDKPTATATP